MIGPFVSVVVPVLYDAAQLETLVARLVAHSDVEVIVSSGAPDDELAALRMRYATVTWIDAAIGRAVQMNRGAAVARGRWLFFLHADARPDEGWLDEIQTADREGCVGGSFAFRLVSTRLAARLVERGVAWRVRWCGLVYGDQGVFVRRDVFERLGGYKPMALMEEVELMVRVGREGRLRRSPVAVRSSPRRWERDGWARRSASNLALLGLYLLGVSPDRLARLYYRGRLPGDRRAAVRLKPDAATTGDDDQRWPIVPGRSVRVPPPLQASEDRRPPSRSFGETRRSLGGGGSLGEGGQADAAPGGPLSPRVAVVMPALNEEEAIGAVLAEIPAFVSRVVVADNGSTDATAPRARQAGAVVVSEPTRGYGRACLSGLREAADADIIVFLDADRSDFPVEMSRLVDPIARDEADFVLGARLGSRRVFAARAGTALCVRLINRLWGAAYTDLGPFRAIRRQALDRLQMADRTWGWTIEMQVKAVEAGLRIREVPVGQRERIGQSKISGTVMGTMRAGSRMLMTIWRLWRTRGERVQELKD